MPSFAFDCPFAFYFPLLLAMLAKAKGNAKAKGKQLMPSFAFDCSTFACDYAPLLLTTQRKGKRRKGKRGALFLCLC
jgi:hypothetical protein